MPQRVTRHRLLDPRRLRRAFDRLVVDLAVEVMTPTEAAFRIDRELLRREQPKTPRDGGVLDGAKRSPKGEARSRAGRIIPKQN
jgi:hypothetical protein